MADYDITIADNISDGIRKKIQGIGKIANELLVQDRVQSQTKHVIPPKDPFCGSESQS